MNFDIIAITETSLKMKTSFKTNIGVEGYQKFYISSMNNWRELTSI